MDTTRHTGPPGNGAVPQGYSGSKVAGVPKRRFGILLAVLIGGGLFFSLTNPTTMPSFVLIAGFAVLGTMIFAVLRLFLQASGIYRRLRPQRRRLVLLTCSLLPILLLMITSMGGLSWLDVITLGGLTVIGIFYAGRMFTEPGT